MDEVKYIVMYKAKNKWQCAIYTFDTYGKACEYARIRFVDTDRYRIMCATPLFERKLSW